MKTEPTYTVEEARRLVPQVRAILLQLAFERRRADRSHAALHGELRATDASTPRQETLEADTAELRGHVRALLELLESMGVAVRDLDEGLVDFPTLRDGERAWLCWKLSDPDLAWWHTTREGFNSRRPL